MSSLPWVEKYRPRTVEEISFQDEVTATLRGILASDATADLPHLLFHGPPGTGKTSSALAFCRTLFPTAGLYKARVMELNASDERGISVVRDKIKTFARSVVTTADKPSDPAAAARVPPFKVVILDEADAITNDAQTALRRTMETHSRITRFILICNYVSKVIDPLASRCAKFRFKALPRRAVTARLLHIADVENLRVAAPREDTLQVLVEASRGDLRRAVTALQAAAAAVAMVPSAEDGGGGAELTAAAAADAACVVPREEVAAFLAAAMRPVFKETKEAALAVVDQGYPVDQLLRQVAKGLDDEEVMKLVREKAGSGVFQGLNDLQRAVAAMKLAEAEATLIEGADEVVQLLDVSARLREVFVNPESEDVLLAR